MTHLKSGVNLGSSKGFTVIELIVVIAVIGILAVMALARTLDSNTINSREVAVMVAADIKRTQELSMADIVNHSITFDGDNTYTLDAEALPVTLPAGMTVSTQTITFNSLGEPVGATTPINLTVGGRANAVTVQPYTGKVSIQ